jgi:hypothetical protein
VRSKVHAITPKKAAEYLEANTSNRPLSRAIVKSFAEAMSRGDWKVTHQGIAFSSGGVLVDGQHRLAAIVEADIPVEMTVFTEVNEGTFDVLDTGKRRNAADVLALDGEKSVTVLAAMVRTVWLYEHRPDLTWSGGSAAVTNHQVVETLAAHPKLREFIVVGDQLAAAIGMIKSAAGAASYLVSQANPKADLTPWFDGATEGAGLAKGDSRLMLRRVMFNMTRKREGQPKRRRDTREHVGLYFKAFNAWAAGETLPQLRFATRDPMPPIATLGTAPVPGEAVSAG